MTNDHSIKTPRILIIAGSDSSGGAGVQADIKTVMALGGYAMTAITAVTVQNTRGVTAVHPIPIDIVLGQIKACIDDIGVDAIKIGMLGDPALAELLGALFLDDKDRFGNVPLIVDPVLVATSGDSLAGDGMVGAIKNSLLPYTHLVTPNNHELAALTGGRVSDVTSMEDAGQILLEMGVKFVLLKGGHLIDHGQNDDGTIVNILLSKTGRAEFRTPRLHNTDTHGTGCTLAAACACALGYGLDSADAARYAIDYVHRAIETAPGFGGGHGPLNHGYGVSPVIKRLS